MSHVTSVKARAEILRSQMRAAAELARKDGLSPFVAEAPYRKMLHKLYREEFALAEKMDREASR